MYPPPTQVAMETTKPLACIFKIPHEAGGMYYVVWGVRKNSSKKLFLVGFDNMRVIRFRSACKTRIDVHLNISYNRLEKFF